MQKAGILDRSDLPCCARVCRCVPAQQGRLLGTVKDSAQAPNTSWQSVRVRATQRATLTDAFAAVRLLT
jgi:hypothetical protein